MGIGSESAKIKSRKLSRFHENFSPRNFLAIRQSRAQTPPSHEEKHPNVPSQISWANVDFCS